MLLFSICDGKLVSKEIKLIYKMFIWYLFHRCAWPSYIMSVGLNIYCICKLHIFTFVFTLIHWF